MVHPIRESAGVKRAMKAIVLAAGRGARLGDLGRQIHKSLIEIGGASLLTRLVRQLVGQGIDEVILVTGYREADLRAELGRSLPEAPVKFIFNPDFDTSNNLVSLHLGLEAVSSNRDVLIVEADLIFDEELIHRLIAHPAPNVAVVDPYRPGLNGTVVTLRGSAITAFHLPHMQSDGWRFAETFKTVNLYKLSGGFCAGHVRPRLQAHILKGDVGSYYELVFAEIVADHHPDAIMHAEIAQPASWAEIDNRNDLDIARYQFEPEGRLAQLDQAFGGLWNYPVIDFAYPSNRRFPNKAALNELRAGLDRLVTQYGSTQSSFERKLADVVGCNPAGIVALNGLSQAYPILRGIFRDDRTLLPAPTFGEYGRHFPCHDTYCDHPGIDWDEVTRKAENSRVIVFVNPNNPTGTGLSSEAIADFASSRPDKTILVDESFADFAEDPGILTWDDAQFPANIIVLKSLGKALGVPGLRLGLLKTNNKVVLEAVRAELPIWSQNSLAEAFLETALRHRSAIARAFQLSRADREDMYNALKGLKLVEHVWPSEANFLLARLRIDDDTLTAFRAQLLDAQGIYVKDVSKKFGRGAWLRLSVRLPEENALLVKAMEAAGGVIAGRRSY